MDLHSSGPGAWLRTRWHPYPQTHRHAASPGSGEPASSSYSKQSVIARNSISSIFRAPRTDAASYVPPLALALVVRLEDGLAFSRSSAAAAQLTADSKLSSARCLVSEHRLTRLLFVRNELHAESAMDILASAWKTVEMTPFPVTARPPADSQYKISAHDGYQYPYQSTAEHMPLKHFIHEVLRRSRTNFVTLQTALCYVDAIVAKLPTLIIQEAEYMVLRALPNCDGQHL